MSQRRYDRLPQIMRTHSVVANGKKRVNDTAAADPTKAKKNHLHALGPARDEDRGEESHFPGTACWANTLPAISKRGFWLDQCGSSSNEQNPIISFLPRQSFTNADLQGFECRGLREKGFPGKRRPRSARKLGASSLFLNPRSTFLSLFIRASKPVSGGSEHTPLPARVPSPRFHSQFHSNFP